MLQLAQEGGQHTVVRGHIVDSCLQGAGVGGHQTLQGSHHLQTRSFKPNLADIATLQCGAKLQTQVVDSLQQSKAETQDSAKTKGSLSQCDWHTLTLCLAAALMHSYEYSGTHNRPLDEGRV